jgi:hypothetical protein
VASLLAISHIISIFAPYAVCSRSVRVGDTHGFLSHVGVLYAEAGLYSTLNASVVAGYISHIRYYQGCSPVLADNPTTMMSSSLLRATVFLGAALGLCATASPSTTEKRSQCAATLTAAEVKRAL